MDGLAAVFKRPKSIKVSGKILDDTKDGVIYDLAYLRDKDLRRENFTYTQILKLGWWPDKILRFIETLRIGYNEFIQVYISTPDIFDVPIRNAIYFMNQKGYNKMAEIAKFLRNGNYEIPD